MSSQSEKYNFSFVSEHFTEILPSLHKVIVIHLLIVRKSHWGSMKKENRAILLYREKCHY